MVTELLAYSETSSLHMCSSPAGMFARMSACIAGCVSMYLAVTYPTCCCWLLPYCI